MSMSMTPKRAIPTAVVHQHVDEMLGMCAGVTEGDPTNIDDAYVAGRVDALRELRHTLTGTWDGPA
jgi:hypothetical protein